jgi:hypothetical protein
MRTLIIFVVVAASVAIGLGDLRAQGPEFRQTRRTAGQRLTDLVRPGDQPVVVVDTSDRPLYVLPPPETSMLEWKTQLADAIVVVEVKNKQSYLSQAGDWIQSEITAEVLQVLKVPREGLAVGRRVSLWEAVGALLVNGTRVSAVVPSDRPMRVGARYLMFSGVRPDTREISLDPFSTYELTGNGQFLRLRDIGSLDDNIEQTVAADVLSAITAAVAAAR